MIIELKIHHLYEYYMNIYMNIIKHPNFLESKFFWPKFFGPKCFQDQKHFLTNKYLDLNKYGEKIVLSKFNTNYF